MALNRHTAPRIFSSLHFRILAPVIPIIFLMVVLGGIVFSLGLNTVSHYTHARVAEDLERISREVYNLCDNALQNLMLEGFTDTPAAVTIRKGNTLGKIEEYARQQDVQIIVYEGDEKKILMRQTAIEPQIILSRMAAEQDKPVVQLQYKGNDYYARVFDFELWGWHIVLVKDGKLYAEFLSTITRSYAAIGIILLLACLILIYYFRRIVHKPVRSIIASIQSNGMPQYQGIYEFEFLSNVIREATQKEQQKQVVMSYQASHDELTGLVNRREFERRLADLLHGSNHEQAQHTILYLDLDQFKIINDTCGHNAGDALLQQLTRLLKDKLRQSDVLARLGGDEFGVLLENCNGEPALRIAELLRTTVGEFRFVWDGKVFTVGVSIGLVTFGNDGLALNDILSIVDGACYIAKEKGRNRIHVYDADDIEVRERRGQMGWVARISHALENDRMVLYKQKIMPLLSEQQGSHFEILLRMVGEQGELIPPMAFLPAAERYNMMTAIDFWVIKNAFQHCEDFYTPLGLPYTCAINLSGATVGNESLAAYIKEQFALYKVPPHAICFEITETAAIANLNSAVTLMGELKQLGCRFALDDFGSGMSSFGYLKTLPVDFIKIDGAFVKSMVHDRIDRAMVEAINNIGHEIGIQTIAEFVENDAVMDELRRLKVDFGQGYGIGRPEEVQRSARARQQPERVAECLD